MIYSEINLRVINKKYLGVPTGFAKSIFIITLINFLSIIC